MNEKSGGGGKVIIIILVILAVVVVVPLCACGGCIYFGASAVKNAVLEDADYQAALRKAESNAEVKEKIGTPIKANFWSGGTFENTNGVVKVRMPISGPNGSGTLIVDGDTAKVEFEGGGEVDLNAE